MWQSQVKYRGTFSASIFDFSGDYADFGLFESGKKEQIIWLCTIEFFLILSSSFPWCRSLSLANRACTASGPKVSDCSRPTTTRAPRSDLGEARKGDAWTRQEDFLNTLKLMTSRRQHESEKEQQKDRKKGTKRLKNGKMLRADFRDTTLSHATSLRQAYDMNCFV